MYSAVKLLLKCKLISATYYRSVAKSERKGVQVSK